MTLHLDLFQSAGVGVCALLLGMLFTRNIPFLKRFCIPAPVSGGLLVSLITLLLYSLGVECTFDGSVKDLCMMLFFTSVGFQSDMKALKQGGKPLLVMIGLVAVLIAAQNLISVGIARGAASRRSWRSWASPARPPSRWRPRPSVSWPARCWAVRWANRSSAGTTSLNPRARPA